MVHVNNKPDIPRTYLHVLRPDRFPGDEMEAVNGDGRGGAGRDQQVRALQQTEKIKMVYHVVHFLLLMNSQCSKVNQHCSTQRNIWWRRKVRQHIGCL